MTYLTVGFPSRALFPSLVEAMVDGGADVIEFGIPFSDPLADGPTIQAASQRALAQGVTPTVVLDSLEKLRKSGIAVPLVLMTYDNLVMHYGVRRFCHDSVSAGADGCIIPDLPPEEADEWISSARPVGLDTIFLAAPTSSPDRLKRIVHLSTGFIYDVSLTGVTGARRDLSPHIRAHVRSIQKMTDCPVCVGFGVSTPAQVRKVIGVADGVIVGSVLLNLISRSGRKAAHNLKVFVRQLKGACRG